MTSRDFAYWLQGYFEINDPKTINKEQTQIIKNHLNLVFKHEIDKQYKPGDGSQEVHDGKIDLIPSLDENNYFNQKPQPGDELIRC